MNFSKFPGFSQKEHSIIFTSFKHKKREQKEHGKVQLSNEKKNPWILVGSWWDPYIGLLYIYNWVVAHPLYAWNN